MSIEEKFTLEERYANNMLTDEQVKDFKEAREPILDQIFDLYSDYFATDEPDNLDDHDFKDIKNYLKDILLTYDHKYCKR